MPFGARPRRPGITCGVRRRSTRSPVSTERWYLRSGRRGRRIRSVPWDSRTMLRWLAVAAGCVISLLATPGQAGAVPASAPQAGWPQVDGQVKAIALVGNRLYIGGSFTTVGGESHANVAALDATTGAVDASFTAATDGTVNALAASGSDLYLGGLF